MHALPSLAMRYRSIMLTLVVLGCLLGILAFRTMPRREDPEFTITTCVVTTRWDGVPADKVEQLVTQPLEEVLDGLEEVQHVRSTSVAGLSTIMVDLWDSVAPADVDQVWDKVRARVDLVAMPSPEVRPVVFDEFGDTSVILFAVHQTPLSGTDQIDAAHTYTHRDLDVYSERVRDALRLLPGVASAQRFGVRQEAIYVETDPGTWKQHQLSADQLSQVLASHNIVQAGGLLETPDGRVLVSPSGEIEQARQIQQTTAATVNGRRVRDQVNLADLGLTVRRGYEEPAGLIGRYGDTQLSQPAVMVALTMQSGANIIDICAAARDRVQRLHDEHRVPPDLAITAVSDQSNSVNARISEVLNNVLQAVIIVVLVVYLAVGFRTAALMAANIPIVMLISMAIIPLLGVQLEQMSLASMIISLGLLVDNAVQVCDQSRTNQMEGMDPVTAAIRGAEVLAFPMLNGTLTTIAAFVPMVIMFEAEDREFIYSLPITLTVMLGVSWVLAMTFCVLLAALVIRAPADRSQSTSPVINLYRALRNRIRPAQQSTAAASQGSSSSSLEAESGWYLWLAGLAIRYRFLTLAISFGLLVAATRLPVSSEFFPLAERDQFVVGVWLPENASLEQTNQVTLQVEDLIRRLSPGTAVDGTPVERLRAMRTLVGGGGCRWYLSWIPEPRKPNYAEILIRTTDGKQTHDFADRVRTVALRGDAELGIEPIAGARIVPIELQLGPPAAPVTLRISGEGFADIAQLRNTTEQVKALVRAQSGTWNVHDSWGADTNSLRVRIDTEMAHQAGVTHAQVADSLNNYLSGKQLTELTEGKRRIPVYFRLAPEYRQSLADLNTSFVEGHSGRVPLESIAQLELDWQPARIERRNLNRTIEVRARVEPGYSGNDIVADVMSSPEMADIQAALPGGFEIEIGGALEESQEATGTMLAAFGTSLITVILLLVIQFNSVSKSLIIVTTLPLAVAGALLGLWMTSNPLGFMPQLGLLALFGIVVNTAIIYIEFADIRIRQRQQERGSPASGRGTISGLSREEYRACLASAGRQRLVPIFLTTATTVGGLLSLALSGGPLWVGMSWLMIYGLLVATVLTLFVVPALCAIVAENLRIAPVPLLSDSPEIS